MRRAVALLFLAALAVAPTGCSGADATEARSLLAQSDAAFAQVKSSRFTGRLTLTGGGEEVVMRMTGGGYVRGKRAGDFFMIATAENLPFGELVVTNESGRMSTTLDGTPIPSAPVPPKTENPLKVAEFSRYVKDVKVEHGKPIDGQPMAKIVGVIDTAGLAEGLLGDMAGGSGLDVSEALGDMRVVLYLSETTHLPMRGLIDVGIEVQGEKLELHFDYAYTGYDKPVEFP